MPIYIETMTAQQAEELTNMATHAEVFPGDTISHRTAEELLTADAVFRNEAGNYQITGFGQGLLDGYMRPFRWASKPRKGHPSRFA